MSVSKCLFMTVGLTLVFGLGCKTEGGVEEHFGESWHANKTLQIANPDAGKEPNNGSIDFEGNTVETVLGRYRRGQDQSPSKNLPDSILDQGTSSNAK
jgi:hypothetical protein